MAETSLAQSLNITESAAFYDANVKYLLADRQVLARILKYAVSEFAEMEIDDVMGCIKDDIEVCAVPIDPGLTNLGRIRGANTEDNIPGEGVIYFDIRFTAYIKSIEIRILINVEAQKSTDYKKLGYHLDNRIIFYMARMISAQKFTEFRNTNYDDLKRVRSIWICMDAGEHGDSIEEVVLHKRTIFGSNPISQDMELVKGVIISIRNGKSLVESRNVLIAMLEKLISQDSVEEKRQFLVERYKMVMSDELEGRMNSMCNWSEAIIESALNEGISKTQKEMAIKQLKRGKLTVEEIAEDTGLSVEDLRELTGSLLILANKSSSKLVGVSDDLVTELDELRRNLESNVSG